MAQTHLESVESLYNERSERYDENEVHIKQAQDYIRWIAPQHGGNLLDLACGTGLVALDAKRRVGESGHVVGVDISEGMLNVARRKAAADGLNLQFFNHDVSNLADIRDKIKAPGAAGFDIITCASALILLPNPLQAVQHWKSLLCEGGRIITDVQTRDANLVMNIFSAIAPELGQSVPWHSGLWQSQQALEQLMVDAGLEVLKSFETDPYATTRFNVDEAPELFNKVVAQSMYQNFGAPEVREKAKDLFIQQFATIAGPSRMVEEETKYWVVVARDPV